MNRTLITATILVLAVVAVPYGAWYVTRSSTIAEDGQRSAQETHRLAGEEVTRLAGQLELRLELLRRFESERPFYHYQNLYHDLAGAHEGASIIPSPLARGLVDPIIAGYFQIDADGKVTLPTINDQIPELNRPDARTEQRLRSVLQTASQKIVAASTRPPPYFRAEPVRHQVMTLNAWRQNDRANELYLTLKHRLDQAPATADDASGDQTVNIEIGPFHWSTLTLDGILTPVALRRVTTPGGPRVQGFVLALANTRQWLRGLRYSMLDVRMLPGPGTEKELAAHVMAISWNVRINLADAIAATQVENDKDRATFLARFALSAGAAFIAAVCIIAIVWQSQRLALQRSRFAALAAHELRTPLAGLQMYGEMLAEGLGDPANVQAYAKRITDEAQRLGRVVSNMLGFSRLERGALRVRSASGDLGAAISECIARKRFELEQAGATLDLNVEADLPPVQFDTDAVGQIMLNLLDNAEKYSRGAEDRTIHISVRRVKRGVTVSVTDHGQGIDRHIQRHLFEAFARARGNDAPAGIGLGLTVAHALIKAHRGTITGKNADGGGAVFTVTFPA